jgi:hypothetical protein
MPLFHPGWGAPQGLVFDRLRVPMHDRLSPNQSGLEKGVNEHPHQSDRSGKPVRSVEQQDGQEFVL